MTKVLHRNKNKEKIIDVECRQNNIIKLVWRASSKLLKPGPDLYKNSDSDPDPEIMKIGIQIRIRVIKIGIQMYRQVYISKTHNTHCTNTVTPNSVTNL